MPFSTSKDTWHSHEDALLQAHSKVVQVEMEKNRKEARKLAMTYEGVSEKITDTVINIEISFDGTCSNRGYTANHRIDFFISLPRHWKGTGIGSNLKGLQHLHTEQIVFI